MRQVKVLLRHQVEASLPSLQITGAKIVFLCMDYELRQHLKGCLGSSSVIDQGWLFYDLSNELRSEVVEAIAVINQGRDASWWDGQIASKSSSANPFYKDIVFFFMALRSLKEFTDDLIFIVNSPVLGRFIEQESIQQNLKVSRNILLSSPCSFLWWTFIMMKSVLKVFFFGAMALIRRYQFKWQKIASFKGDKRIPNVLIRTWVTEGNYTANGFEERVFGSLADFLRQRGKNVIFYPMFFNMTRNLRQAYQGMAQKNIQFIVCEEWVGLKEIWTAVIDSLKLVFFRVGVWKIQGKDLKMLLHEAVISFSMDSLLFGLNLHARSLAALKKRGFNFESVIYPFENNAPEKSFILGVRRLFPDALLIGFAHSAFFREQLSFHLEPQEYKYHPIPDKIVTNGKRYVGLLTEANFPQNIIVEGPNLRFSSIHRFVPGQLLKESQGTNKDILVPLTFSYSLAFDILDKLQKFQETKPDVKVLIRNHPLLDESKIKSYALRIKMNIDFAYGGSFTDWLRKTGVVVTTGTSITTLEAMICGIPVIRVAPDLELHYDSCHDAQYPIPVVNAQEELIENYTLARSLRLNQPEVLIESAHRVMKNYFNPPEDHLMSLFIRSKN